jgi:hypothetical protein
MVAAVIVNRSFTSRLQGLAIALKRGRQHLPSALKIKPISVFQRASQCLGKDIPSEKLHLLQVSFRVEIEQTARAYATG